MQNLVDDVVVGAMGVNTVKNFFKHGVLLITPGDREDTLFAVAASLGDPEAERMAGIVLTGNLRPRDEVFQVIQSMPFPVLLSPDESYRVASRVHNLTVKTRPADTEKISLIRDLIAQNVNVKKILESL
jgi:BioD-like phosphotransacetylase family protein